MSEYEPTKTLDVKGLSCPMPVVKTRGAVDDLTAGEILKVVSTDSGSMSDLKGWADATSGVSMVDQEEDEDGGESIYVHFVQKE